MVLYDNGDPYIYVKKMKHPNPEYEYVITGGEDHKVGIEGAETHQIPFAKLEGWKRRNTYSRDGFGKTFGRVQLRHGFSTPLNMPVIIRDVITPCGSP